jgi:hypothetical protein
MPEIISFLFFNYLSISGQRLTGTTVKFPDASAPWSPQRQ